MACSPHKPRNRTEVDATGGREKHQEKKIWGCHKGGRKRTRRRGTKRKGRGTDRRKENHLKEEQQKERRTKGSIGESRAMIGQRRRDG